MLGRGWGSGVHPQLHKAEILEISMPNAAISQHLLNDLSQKRACYFIVFKKKHNLPFTSSNIAPLFNSGPYQTDLEGKERGKKGER